MVLQINRVTNRRSVLDPVCISCTAPEDDDLTFATTEHWKIVLHPDQTVPGALLLTSLRHVPKLSELTPAESAEWFLLYAVVERSLEQFLGADMVTVACQRNWAYRAENPEPPLRDGRPNPHVHWHVAPRYSQPVTVADEVFDDVDFGDPLVWRGRRAPVGVRSSLVAGLLGTFGKQSGNIN